MIHLERTDSTHPDFIGLVKWLDDELAERDGADHAFYAQFNKIDMIKNVILAYNDHEPVGCGAIKPYAVDIMEVKRMFVLTAFRGQGVAAKILTGLEKWAKDLGYCRCILETGFKQPEAISLYKRHGYNQIPNYGQYAGVENSICFEKLLR